MNRWDKELKVIACDESTGNCIYEGQGLLFFVISFFIHLIFKTMHLSSHDGNKN